jgi:Tfp pilus assembly protein PilN
MRPVNLIPMEERRGDSAPLRTGPTVYVLLGALTIALLTITMLVLTGNGIKDQEAELDSLAARQQAADASVAALTPYTQFATMAAGRNATVTSLADSRFDWERVLRELSLIIPSDVTLLSATGATSAGSDGSSDVASAATGPSLSLTGCAAGQRGVAEFAAALHDIDGVTRVGVNSSQLGQSDESGGGSDTGGQCEGGTAVSQFEIAAVFDGATTPSDGSAAVPPATGETAATDPGTGDAVAEEQQSRDAAAEQTGKARNAANLAPGVDQ